MPKYAAHVTNFTTSSTSTTMIRIGSISNRRCEVVECIMTGAGATTPADVGHDCQLSFLNAFGTTGWGTASPLPGPTQQFVKSSAASSASVAIRFQKEPTVYDLVFPVYFGFNQRGGQRWSVPQGEGVKVDSGTATGAGLGQLNQSSASGAANSSLNWWED